MSGTDKVCSGHLRAAALCAAAVGAMISLGACNRLDDYTAAELHEPHKRHPIAYTSRSETLYVEVAPSGLGLSPNQEADVFRFAERYKAESTGSLRIETPRSAGSHLAASRSAREIENIVLRAGIDPRAVRTARTSAHMRGVPALRLTYNRPVALPPECRDWNTDLGENRERLPYNDYGCSTQRNLALNVANSRDLLGPRDESELRPSEARGSQWTKYIKGGNSGAGRGQSVESGSQPSDEAGEE